MLKFKPTFKIARNHNAKGSGLYGSILWIERTETCSSKVTGKHHLVKLHQIRHCKGPLGPQQYSRQVDGQELRKLKDRDRETEIPSFIVRLLLEFKHNTAQGFFAARKLQMAARDNFNKILTIKRNS